VAKLLYIAKLARPDILTVTSILCAIGSAGICQCCLCFSWGLEVTKWCGSTCCGCIVYAAMKKHKCVTKSPTESSVDW